MDRERKGSEVAFSQGRGTGEGREADTLVGIEEVREGKKSFGKVEGQGKGR